MCRALKMKDKMEIFLGGMSKAFDSRNTKSLYGRKRSFSPSMMYGAVFAASSCEDKF